MVAPWTTWSKVFATLLLLGLSWPLGLRGQKFYEDDPLRKIPPTRNVEKVTVRRVNDYYDFIRYTFLKQGEHHSETRTIPAQAVNTLGDVPDSDWYTNRHYQSPMTLEELVRGPGNENPPSMEGPWKVVAAKTEGITPGFTILDSKGRRYILKFDSLKYPELATAADVISSKFFHALGYHVPENYIVFFGREQLVVGEGVTVEDPTGRERKMTERDVTEILLKAPRNSEGKYRAVASRFLAGQPVGPFRFHGTRWDDPNDIVPHEHRRDLRGLSVFAAWLGHDDSRAINTLDMLVQENGIQYVKHHLIDFGSTLGSATTRPNSPRSGHEYLFSWKLPAIQFATFGLLVPQWAKAKFPDLPSVGNFEAERFDPETWVPEYPNPAFLNRLPDDAFWAAKQVMAFTDKQIRAIVKTGQYSDPEAQEWVSRTLIARRNRIGKAFFAKVLPLDGFHIKEDELVFRDLAVEHRFVFSRQYRVQWSRFDNDTQDKLLLEGETTFALPKQFPNIPVGGYLAVDIRTDEPEKTVTVYLRKEADGPRVVGIDRRW